MHFTVSKTVTQSKSIKSFSSRKSDLPDHDNLATKAELLFSVAYVEHNILFLFVDHLDLLLKAALRDSEVAKLFQSKRTKAYLITDGLYPKVKDDLIRKMKNQQFSLMVDQSNKNLDANT